MLSGGGNGVKKSSPQRGGGFADGRSKTSPDSERPTSRVRKLENSNEGTQFVFSTEGTFNASWSRQQIEYTVAKQHVRNSESVEQIQDRARVQVRGVTSSYTEEQHSQSAECRLKTQAVCRTFQANEDTFNANVVIGNEES